MPPWNMLPPVNPNVLSKSNGDKRSAPTIDLVNPGAYCSITWYRKIRLGRYQKAKIEKLKKKGNYQTIIAGLSECFLSAWIIPGTIGQLIRCILDKELNYVLTCETIRRNTEVLGLLTWRRDAIIKRGWYGHLYERPLWWDAINGISEGLI